MQAEPSAIKIRFFSNSLPLLLVQRTQTIHLKPRILEDFEFEFAKYARYNKYFYFCIQIVL